MKLIKCTAILIIVFIALYGIECRAGSRAKTLPTSCVVIYGDSRTNHSEHGKVVSAMMKVRPVAVFHTGDLVGNGEIADDWKMFYKITRPILESCEFFPSLGNHERNAQLYFDNFELPGNERWYSIDRGGIHFIILDSNWDLSDTSEQYLWLEADLSQSVRDSAAFTSVLFHHPLFTTGLHKEDQMGLKPVLIPLFERYGVDIVFSGHNHQYERSYYNSIYYVVTAGGGAPLYGQERTSPYSQVVHNVFHFCEIKVVDGELVVVVYSERLKELDRFRISSTERLQPLLEDGR